MHGRSPAIPASKRSAISQMLRPCLVAGLLGAAAALPVSCASSTGGLIPTGNAGPLQSDFEEVERAARSGNGSCNATETAIAKTEQDFVRLPRAVDHGLRTRLHEGIAALRSDALKLCGQPLPATTSTSPSPRTTPTTTSTATTPMPTHTTGTATTPTTSTPTTSGPGGGTAAPPAEAPGAGTEPGGSSGEGKGAGEGKEKGEGKGVPGLEGARRSDGQDGGK
jgi:hypothetical protein